MSNQTDHAPDALPGQRASRLARMRARRTRRGAIAMEYAFLLVIVGVPTVIGVIAGGVKLLNDYDVGRQAILNPSP